MALPIWALYMKKNYADEDLGVSTEEFEKPEELSIKVECTPEEEETDTTPDLEDDLDDLDF